MSYVWILYYVSHLANVPDHSVMMVYGTQKSCVEARQRQIDMHIDKAATESHLVCVREWYQP